jgi:hypothetical protein
LSINYQTSQPASSATPTGAAFDLVLIVHVACVLIGLASLFTTGLQAWRSRAGPGSRGAASVARYFRPGINWPGRTLYAVLLFGVLLVAMSQDAYGFSDPFVQIGLVLWILAVAVAEMVVWPGERRIQQLVADSWVPRPNGLSSDPPVAATESAADGLAIARGFERGLATRVAVSAWIACAVLIVAIVVMVQKP